MIATQATEFNWILESCGAKVLGQPNESSIVLSIVQVYLYSTILGSMGIWF